MIYAWGVNFSNESGRGVQCHKWAKPNFTTTPVYIFQQNRTCSVTLLSCHLFVQCVCISIKLLWCELINKIIMITHSLDLFINQIKMLTA